jgi:intracellular sulfur oxidation DsrE/DsrF family protein
MKTITFLSLLLLGSLFNAFRCYAQHSPTHKVVMQFTTADTAAHRALMNQLNNLLEGFGEEQLEMEVVCHNNGISLLMQEGNIHKAAIEKLQKRGIKFLACQQTLKQRKIAIEQLIPCQTVPRGLVWIIERQESNWSYLKGGF